MRKIVIIGASDFQLPLIKKAKELKYETHVFAWKCGDIGESEADYFYPISIVEKEVIYEICKLIKPDAITSVGSDLAVITVTYVAKKLGLISNDYKDSVKCTNKYEMRRTFKKNNIYVPNFQIAENTKDIMKIDSFPKIVKPTDRSGSRAISLVRNLEELKEAVKNAIDCSFEKKAIIEDVIDGEEYSCETISYKGSHKILSITKKFTTGFPDCIETGHLQPAGLSNKYIKKVKESTKAALDALNIKYGPSHTEFKISKNGNIHIIEVGARMGGDCIGTHLVELSTGYDFLKMTIDISMGYKPKFEKKVNYKYALIKFIFNEDDLKKLETINKKFPKIIKEKSQIKKINHKVVDSSTRFGYYICAFNEEKILNYIIREVKLYEKN